MTQAKVSHITSEQNAIQKHVNFWDTKRKGYITPIDIILGLISLGYGVIFSTALGSLVAISLSVALQVSWWSPDLLCRFSASALVMSRQQTSGAFDSNGIFNQKEFEAIFNKHTRSRDYITILELVWLTRDQRQLGFSPKAWAIAMIELCVAYFLVGNNGCLSKNHLKALYDGTLFYEIKANNTKQVNDPQLLKKRETLPPSKYLPPIEKKEDCFDKMSSGVTDAIFAEKPIPFLDDLARREYAVYQGLQKEEFYDTTTDDESISSEMMQDFAVEENKAGANDSSMQALVKLETAIVLHRSCMLLSLDNDSFMPCAPIECPSLSPSNDNVPLSLSHTETQPDDNANVIPLLDDGLPSTYDGEGSPKLTPTAVDSLSLDEVHSILQSSNDSALLLTPVDEFKSNELCDAPTVALSDTDSSSQYIANFKPMLLPTSVEEPTFISDSSCDVSSILSQPFDASSLTDPKDDTLSKISPHLVADPPKDAITTFCSSTTYKGTATLPRNIKRLKASTEIISPKLNSSMIPRPAMTLPGIGLITKPESVVLVTLPRPVAKKEPTSLTASSENDLAVKKELSVSSPVMDKLPTTERATTSSKKKGKSYNKKSKKSKNKTRF